MATDTKAKPKARRGGGAAAAPAAPAAAPAAPRSEGALYTPDPDVVVVDGQRFRVGKMRIGASLRFTDWVTKFLGRGAQAAQTLGTLTDPQQRAAATSALTILTLLPEDDVAELVAIALSNDEQVDRAWVAEHWDLDWVLPLLERFTELNPLGRYFVSAGKVMRTLQAQFAAAQTPTNGATRSR